MRLVAKRADTKLGNLHYYFPTKQELMLAIFSRASSSYREDIRNSMQNSSTPNEQLASIVSVSLDEFNKPGLVLWRILIAIAQHDPRASDVLQQEHKLYHDSFADALLSIAPNHSKKSRLRVARLFWATLDGLYLQADNARGETPNARTHETALTIMLTALLSAETEP